MAVDGARFPGVEGSPSLLFSPAPCAPKSVSGLSSVSRRFTSLILVRGVDIVLVRWGLAAVKI